jgi:hypothetical protein
MRFYLLDIWRRTFGDLWRWLETCRNDLMLEYVGRLRSSRGATFVQRILLSFSRERNCNLNLGQLRYHVVGPVTCHLRRKAKQFWNVVLHLCIRKRTMSERSVFLKAVESSNEYMYWNYCIVLYGTIIRGNTLNLFCIQLHFKVKRHFKNAILTPIGPFASAPGPSKEGDSPWWDVPLSVLNYAKDFFTCCLLWLTNSNLSRLLNSETFIVNVLRQLYVKYYINKVYIFEYILSCELNSWHVFI